MNDCLNQPLFSETTTAFEIKKQKVKPEDALLITKETLLRLHETRAEHKEIREKFDPNSASMLKNNKTMTFEDNIHQGTVETFFKTSLRPENTGCLLAKKSNA